MGLTATHTLDHPTLSVQTLIDAWSDRDLFQVIVDQLLEEGQITAPSGPIDKILSRAYYPPHSPVDEALFETEVRARDWILLKLRPEGDLQLRVTGGWPDISFVVCPKTDWWAWHFQIGPTEHQPRLLRRSEEVI